MKAAASSQLAFEPASFPPWGWHFWKVSYSSSSQSWRGLPRGRKGEKQPQNKGVSREVAEWKCQNWHLGDLRSREKVGLVYLSSPGFLSLAIFPSVLTHAGWKARISSPVPSLGPPRPTGPLDKKKLSNPLTPSYRNKHHGRKDDGKTEDTEECWETSWPVLSRTFLSSGSPHKVTQMRSMFPQAALIGLRGLQNFNFLLKKKKKEDMKLGRNMLGGYMRESVNRIHLLHV